MSPGETVKALRLDRGMTQRELSKRTGLTQPALSAIEHGGEPLGLARAVRIAEVLGVDYRDIFGRPTANRSTRVANRISTSAKPPQLTDEEWAEVEGRSTSKSIEGEDDQKWLRGEYVPEHRWSSQRAGIFIKALIEKTPGVVGGSARITRTRIPVWTLENYRQLGATTEQILEAFPALREEDVIAAWAYIAANIEEVARDIAENA